jgi:hypothetical protein
MKTCTYISGSCCVGKSTVASAVGDSLSSISFIRGDDYWRTYPDLQFEERVLKTNQDILAALQNSDASDLLCEWVPSRGPFVAQLFELCVSARRQFLHVGLTAPISVLQSRKREHDGVEDTAPGAVSVPEQQTLYDCMVFDTETEKTVSIADAVSKWILYNKQLKATGEPAP